MSEKPPLPITPAESRLFDEALAWFKTMQEKYAPGTVLRFRGIPVNEVKWTDRDRLRVVLEYQKETTGIVQRGGNVMVFPPSMKVGAVAHAPGTVRPSFVKAPSETAGDAGTTTNDS